MRLMRRGPRPFGRAIIAVAGISVTSTVNDGLPDPDSRLAMVERGTAAAFANAPCVSPRACRKPAKLRAR